jgi:hypothetical protein
MRTTKAMSPFYRRTAPGPRENLGAALVAAGLAIGVASISFYLVRTFLAREPLEPLPNSSGEDGKNLGENPQDPEVEEDGG